MEAPGEGAGSSSYSSSGREGAGVLPMQVDQEPGGTPV